jgi:hypothetical protein
MGEKMIYYKGLDADWKDLQTHKTLYTKGKVIKIPKGKRGKELCSKGVLHASQNIFDIFKSVKPKKFCIVKGKPVVSDKIKSGFHEYKVVKRLSQLEINKAFGMNFDLTPITSFFKRVVKPTENDIKLLNEWGSVSGSVWDSVWDSVWGSVWDSVWGSVWGSVYCYIGSLFTGIKKWRGLKHKAGEYPFKAGSELIKKGLMPYTDGKKLYLLSGKARTKWTIVHEELKK